MSDPLLPAARVALQALNDALRDDDLERARRVLERFVAQAGATPAARAKPATKSPTKPGRSAASTDPERDVRRWLRAYAKVFTEWDLEEANQLAAIPPEVPRRLDRAPGLVRNGTAAALSGRHSDAREMLDLLLRSQDAALPPRFMIAAVRRAQLLVYLGRISLSGEIDLERASSCFTTAERLAPEDPVVHAALGELHRARDETAAATQSFQHAVAVARTSPDGYVGMGLLSEDAGRHDEAAEWFGRALALLGDRFEHARRLLAPVPPGLLLARGRRDPDAALGCYDEALDALGDDQDELRARIQLVRAPLLAEPDPGAAAQAYFEAATLVALDWDAQRELLELATGLDPGHARAQWELAEGLRMQSQAEEDEGRAQTLVDAAIAAWDRGEAAERPAADLSWVYVSRALMHERLARLQRSAPAAEQWAAVAMLERAIVADDAEGYRWMHLTRVLRLLRLRANAVEASARAIELQPYDVDVMVERCETLIDAGELEAAAAAIEPAVSGECGAWTVATAGWAFCESGRHQDAIDLVDAALAGEDADVEAARSSLLALRARCLNRLQRSAEERAALEAIVELPADSTDQRDQRARALYALGRGDPDGERLREAHSIFSELTESEPHESWIRINLGLVRIATGDAGGAEDIRLGAASFRLRLEFEELARDLAELRELAPEPAGAVIDGLSSELEQRAPGAGLPAAEDELHEHRGEPAAAPATALTLARLRRARGDWPGAIASALSPGPELDRAARDDLAELTVSGASSAAGAMLESGYPDEARSVLVPLLELAEADGHPARAARVHALLALALLRLGDAPGARAAVGRAVALFAESGAGDPAGSFWDVVGSRAAGAVEVWALEELVPAAAENEAGWRPLPAARFIASLADWPSGDEPLHDPRPVVYLGDALIPEDTGPEWPLFKTLMPELRARIEADTGITVPGARFRAGAHLTPSEYEIVVAGLTADRAPVPAGTRGDGDPIERVVERLEYALRRHLDEFVTLDDAMLRVGDSAGSRRRDLPADRAAKLRVAAMLRALAADGVPLTEPGAIVAAAERHDDVRSAIESVRRRARADLPGATAAHMLELDDDIAERINRAFDLDAGTLQAAASPADAVQIERELADRIAASGAAAVVVDGERLRRVVQRLLRRRAPAVPVLSRAEIATAPAAQSEEELHA